MSALDAIHTAQADVAKAQTALGSVQGGLDTVETVAETVSDARRGLRRAFKLGLLLTVIGIVAVVVVSMRSRRSPQSGRRCDHSV